MKNTSYFLLPFLLIFFFPSTSHTQTLKGQVLDENGEALPFANIVEVETKNGTSSDSQGFFQLELLELPTRIEISFVGYHSISININDTTDLTLEPVALKLSNIDINFQPIVIAKAIEERIPFAATQLHQDYLLIGNQLDYQSILNQSPGLYMQSGAYNTNRITIRGVGNRSPYGTSKIRSYLDEIPLTNGDGATILEDIDLSWLRSIDIIKGPTASIYGAGLGGLIKLNSKNTALQASGLKLTNESTIGSYGLFRNASQVEFNAAQQKLSAFASFTSNQVDGYRDNNEYDRKATALLLKKEFKNEQHLSLLFNYSTVEAEIPSSINRNDYEEDPSRAAANWEAINGKEDYNKLLAGIIYQSPKLKFQNNTIVLKTSLFTNSRQNDELRPFNQLQEESTAFGGRLVLNLLSKDNNELIKDFYPLSVGTEIYSEQYDWKTIGVNNNEGVLLSDNEENRFYINYFLQSYLKLSKNLFFLGGLNVNSTKYKYDNVFNANTISTEKNFNTIFSPRIGLTYQINNKFNIYSSVSHGFSPPATDDTRDENGTFNQNIEPEKGWNYEIGIKNNSWRNALNYELSFYWMDIQDLIVADRIAPDTYVSINAGKTRHKGLEAFIEYRPSFSKNFWNPLIFVSYSYQDYEFLEFNNNGESFDGNKLTGTPPHQLTTGLNLNFYKGFGITLRSEYIDAFPIRDDNTASSEAYTLFHTKASYILNLNNFQFQVNLGVNNLFDKKYASMMLINAPSFGGALPRYYYPGRPRNYFTSIRLSYRFQ